jgi:hypothetical protein
MQQFYSLLPWSLFRVEQVLCVSRSSLGGQSLQWKHLVLLSYHGESYAVIVVGPARPDNE